MTSGHFGILMRKWSILGVSGSCWERGVTENLASRAKKSRYFDVLERGVCHIIAILPYCCELCDILVPEWSILWHHVKQGKTKLLHFWASRAKVIYLIGGLAG